MTGIMTAAVLQDFSCHARLGEGPGYPHYLSQPRGPHLSLPVVYQGLDTNAAPSEDMGP